MGIFRSLSIMALCGVLAFGLLACGDGSSSGGGKHHKTITGTLTSLYNSSGANWNDYVQGGNITNATDVACDPDTDTACIHAGEIRSVEVTGKHSCTGLTATDALGAFDWTCDDSTDPVRMVSSGLADGKHLSDLLDFDAQAWKEDSVTVKAGGTAYLKTPSEAWWGNPIELANDGGILNSSGTIYVVTDTAVTPDYIINATSVGLVAAPGAIINADASTSSTMIWADGSSTAKDFLWLEGAVNSNGADNNGVYLYYVRFSRLDNLTSDDSGNNGIVLNQSMYNTLKEVAASSNSDGFKIYASSNNTFSGVTASNNTNGVHLQNSGSNTFSDVTASNNSYSGVFVQDCVNNTFSDLTASNNNDEGVYLYYSFNNRLSDVIASNNATGIYLDSSNNNVLTNVTASNNGNNGVVLWYSSNNMLSDVTASNSYYTGVNLFASSHNNTFSDLTASNSNYGVYLSSFPDNNYFTGLLKVGSNALDDCYVSGGTNPGLVNTTCTTDGSYGSSDYGIGNISDAALYNGVDLSSSFVGRTYTDSVNADATGSAVSYPVDPATFDWMNFENQYRAWGKDGAFGTAGSQRQWTFGYGAIWDWSVSASDAGEYDSSPAILGVLNTPTGDDTLTHTWSDSSTTTFLRHAVEISGDGIGNDNLLCESGETCLYTPNIGSYQGHGNLVSAGSIGTGGTLENITLLQYETNGR